MLQKFYILLILLPVISFGFCQFSLKLHAFSLQLIIINKAGNLFFVFVLGILDLCYISLFASARSIFIVVCFYAHIEMAAGAAFSGNL